MKRKLTAAAILLTGLSVFFTLTASAYVDPTTTTFLIQALAGVVAVVGTAVAIFWRRAKKKLGIDETKNMEVEDEFAVVDETTEPKPDETAEPKPDETAEPKPEKEKTAEAEDEEIDFDTADE